MHKKLLCRALNAFCILGIVAGMTACAGKVAKKEGEQALYYRLGARKELGKIVTETVDNWVADQRLAGNAAVKDLLGKTDGNILKRGFYSFICWAANGPCTFRQDSLQESVQGLKITQVEWYYMLEGLMAALTKHSVPIAEQNEVMDIAYSIQAKIIGQ